jgi:hypothetical protein
MRWWNVLVVVFLGAAIAAIAIATGLGRRGADHARAAQSSGVEFTMHVGTCSTAGDQKASCAVPLGSTFEVTVSLDSFSGTSTNSYDGVAVTVAYTGVGSKENPNIVWPGCVFEAPSTGPGQVNAGCTVGANAPASMFTGAVFTADFNCVADGQLQLVHTDSDTLVTDHASLTFHEAGPDVLNIDCALVTATPTLTATVTPTSTSTRTPTRTPTPTSTPTPCMVSGLPDSDCDGMPNLYENAHSCLHMFTPDGGADPDFDTKPNLVEYAKGSNPCSGDTDGDGKEDSIDGCQLLSEDFDGVADGDGCPEYDNDSDGICDAYFAPAPPGPVACTIPPLPSPRYAPAYPGGPAPDRCPNVSEDLDAFKDLDGCPEADNDNDGHPDSFDDCPGTDYTAGPDGIADTGDEPLDAYGVPIQTREDYDGIIDGDGCHDSPGDDYDHDGCSDEREAGQDEKLGGRRDPTNPWDYFNPSGDRINRVDDVLLVVQHYFNDLGSPGYESRFDRTFQGPRLWNSGPPDGLIRVDDVLNIVHQYGNDCA